MNIMKKRMLSLVGVMTTACICIAAIIIVNTTLTSWRIDLTENKLFTLSYGTLNIIQHLEEPIKLDFYLSKKSLIEYPNISNYSVRVHDMLQEYNAHANGKLILNIIEPEPFSELEDQANASGLRNIVVNTAGDRAYFGLVGTNSTDDEKIIPFFQSNRETALEYDITKLIYNLAYPDKPIVGILSDLPVFGKNNVGAWTMINALREFFVVEELAPKQFEIDPNIDVLMLIHPKKPSAETLYAIDQYLLAGGMAMIFIDPFAEHDQTTPDPNQPNVLPQIDSYLDKLLKTWGLGMIKQKVAGDLNAAVRVQYNSPTGVQQIDYLPWLSLSKQNFNAVDFSTNELNLINMGSAGIIEVIEDKGLSIIPLLQTSNESTLLERDLILFQRDPSIILNNYKATNRPLLLAAKIAGQVNSAFTEALAENQKFIDKGSINIILVSDTDILADRFWIQQQNFSGNTSAPTPIANNGDFIINNIERLAGSADLASLRGREKYARPFERVESLRRNAEVKFRKREQELLEKLKETESNILSLQENNQGYVADNALSKEIQKFREEQLKTRRELRTVQHSLKKDIESLGQWLRFINIGFMPILITIIMLFIAIYNSRKQF